MQDVEFNSVLESYELRAGRRPPARSMFQVIKQGTTKGKPSGENISILRPAQSKSL